MKSEPMSHTNDTILSEPPNIGRRRGSLESFRQAKTRYRPDPLRVLFIAEAPPAFKVNRLFYFLDLTDGDTLFLEMMKVLYPLEVGFIRDRFQPGTSVKQIRQRKPELLRKFQE